MGLNDPKTEPMDDCRLDQIEGWLAADPHAGGVIMCKALNECIFAADLRALVARVMAAEARVAELAGVLRAAAPFVSDTYWNECEEFDATCDSCLAVRVRKLVDAVLFKPRQESPDA